MNATRTVLKVENLKKVYSLGSLFNRIKIEALGGVSFEIQSDEPVVVSLIGESGSGKTTLAKILLRIVDSDGGSAKVEDRPVSDKKGKVISNGALRQLIQPIFQNPFEAFNAYRKVENYLSDTAELINKVAGEEKTREVVAEALKSVGLNYGDVVGKYPSQFSGGELQRISVARALIPKPKLIVADEPVSMIDASLRMNVVNLFRKIKKDYRTNFLYITHDLATAYYISDFIVIMYRGCIVEFGKADAVLRDPLHPYTRLLLDSVPSVDKKWEKREKMADLEAKEYGFAGCKFCGRCDRAMDICRASRPMAIRQKDGRDVYCFLYG
jgi:peptide/nickel transport system ATP-binding protein